MINLYIYCVRDKHTKPMYHLRLDRLSNDMLTELYQCASIDEVKEDGWELVPYSSMMKQTRTYLDHNLHFEFVTLELPTP